MASILNGDQARSRRIRREKYALQNGCCHWCGFEMSMAARPGLPVPTYATFEHLVPAKDGGTGRQENLKLACWLCNQLRGVLYLALSNGERGAAT